MKFVLSLTAFAMLVLGVVAPRGENVCKSIDSSMSCENAVGCTWTSTGGGPEDGYCHQ
ncbi:uncharacterized protein L969DRAFT_75113 [Mixia osmundae IAM 14324]|uniref:CBM1 domain-containing protein n=1 Tax=Mixia osmundae (strain CBS 9802 / IAM 14324 / JCM 22182 / KY 12970) TaxID=764103 RepID=G7E467_MIXOS|nr:uncharacterized protein L969DRAFT_75113 [Mixia osmundae IAM 14324]KEI39723.1 hypothetical protein L969DRAFT_75113 [Mixia osmundae IAM 14324]GAA97627.1 hypothetical protein E5Q_04305 [Mixia osmundae IAM 14324]